MISNNRGVVSNNRGVVGGNIVRVINVLGLAQGGKASPGSFVDYNYNQMSK